jgi:RNA recognition motif-containing protein
MGWAGNDNGKGKSTKFEIQHPDKTVWLGGLSEGTTHTDLMPVMAQAGMCKMIKVGGKGTGFAFFSSPEEAQYAISSLNGAMVKGSRIQVDTWAKKEKGAGGKGGKAWGGNAWGASGNGGSQSGTAAIWQALAVLQAGAGGKGKGKGKWKPDSIKKADNSCKVWIGNVPSGITHTELQPHMDQSGKTKFVAVNKNKGLGTAAAIYSNATDAANAVAMLNGSVLGGQAIVVDAWEKAEKAGGGKGKSW